jgi:hypothetical protein
VGSFSKLFGMKKPLTYHFVVLLLTISLKINPYDKTKEIIMRNLIADVIVLTVSTVSAVSAVSIFFIALAFYFSYDTFPF